MWIFLFKTLNKVNYNPTNIKCMKKLILLSVLFISFTSMANDGWPSRSSTKTHKFEVKKGFNYKKHHKKNKKARKHSPCRHVNFN